MDLGDQGSDLDASVAFGKHSPVEHRMPAFEASLEQLADWVVLEETRLAEEACAFEEARYVAAGKTAQVS